MACLTVCGTRRLLVGFKGTPRSEDSSRKEVTRLLMGSRLLRPSAASALCRVKRAGNSDSAMSVLKASPLCFLKMVTVGIKYAIICCGTQASGWWLSVKVPNAGAYFARALPLRH